MLLRNGDKLLIVLALLVFIVVAVLAIFGLITGAEAAGGIAIGLALATAAAL